MDAALFELEAGTVDATDMADTTPEAANDNLDRDEEAKRRRIRLRLATNN